MWFCLISNFYAPLNSSSPSIAWMKPQLVFQIQIFLMQSLGLYSTTSIPTAALLLTFDFSASAINSYLWNQHYCWPSFVFDGLFSLPAWTLRDFHTPGLDRFISQDQTWGTLDRSRREIRQKMVSIIKRCANDGCYGYNCNVGSRACCVTGLIEIDSHCTSAMWFGIVQLLVTWLSDT